MAEAAEESWDVEWLEAMLSESTGNDITGVATEESSSSQHTTDTVLVNPSVHLTLPFERYTKIQPLVPQRPLPLSSGDPQPPRRLGAARKLLETTPTTARIRRKRHREKVPGELSFGST